jgi:hypothetical protein
VRELAHERIGLLLLVLSVMNIGRDVALMPRDDDRVPRLGQEWSIVPSSLGASYRR